MARPVGSTSRPQFYQFTSAEQRREYVEWVMANYKDKPEIAKWVGDQIFGRAAQSVDLTSGGKPLLIGIGDE